MHAENSAPQNSAAHQEPTGAREGKQHKAPNAFKRITTISTDPQTYEEATHGLLPLHA